MANLKITFEGKDNLTPKIDKIIKSIDQIKKEVNITVKAAGVDLAASSIDKLSKKTALLSTAGNIAADFARDAGRKLLQFGKDSIKAASDVDEMRAKSSVVFGSMTNDVRKWSAELGNSIGRSKTDIEGFASTFQDTFVPMGIARNEATGLSKTITKLGLDLASFNNKADADTMRDLHAALVGNHKTMYKYGVVIKESTLNQELLTMGIEGGNKAATEQQKVMARLNLIMKGTSDAQGDAERTAGSFENQTKKLSANLKELSINIGNSVIPVLQTLMPVVNNIITDISNFVLKLQDFGKTDFGRTILTMVAGITTFSITLYAVNTILKSSKTLIDILKGSVKLLTKEYWAQVYAQIALMATSGNWAGLAIAVAAAAAAMYGINVLIKNVTKDMDELGNVQSNTSDTGEKLANALDNEKKQLDEITLSLENTKKAFQDLDQIESQLGENDSAFDELAEDVEEYKEAHDEMQRQVSKNNYNILKSQRDLNRAYKDYSEMLKDNRKAEYELQKQINDKKEEFNNRINQSNKEMVKTEIEGLSEIIKKYKDLDETISGLTERKEEAQRKLKELETGLEESEEDKRLREIAKTKKEIADIDKDLIEAKRQRGPDSTIQEAQRLENIKNIQKQIQNINKESDMLKSKGDLSGDEEKRLEDLIKLKNILNEQLNVKAPINPQTLEDTQRRLEELYPGYEQLTEIEKMRLNLNESLAKTQQDQADLIKEHNESLYEMYGLEWQLAEMKADNAETERRAREDLIEKEIAHAVLKFESQKQEDQMNKDLAKSLENIIKKEERLNELLGKRIDLLDQLDRKNSQSSNLYRSNKAYENAEKNYRAALGAYQRNPSEANARRLAGAKSRLDQAESGRISSERGYYEQDILSKEQARYDAEVKARNDQIIRNQKDIDIAAQQKRIAQIIIRNKFGDKQAEDFIKMTPEKQIDKILEIQKSRRINQNEKKQLDAIKEYIEKERIARRGNNLPYVTPIRKSLSDFPEETQREIEKRIERHRQSIGAVKMKPKQEAPVAYQPMPRQVFPYVTPEEYERGERQRKEQAESDRKMRESNARIAEQAELTRKTNETTGYILAGLLAIATGGSSGYAVGGRQAAKKSLKFGIGEGGVISGKDRYTNEVLKRAASMRTTQTTRASVEASPWDPTEFRTRVPQRARVLEETSNMLKAENQIKNESAWKGAIIGAAASLFSIPVVGEYFGDLLNGANQFNEDFPGLDVGPQMQNSTRQFEQNYRNKQMQVNPMDTSNLRGAVDSQPFEIDIKLDKNLLTTEASKIIQSPDGRTAIVRIIRDDQRRS